MLGLIQFILVLDLTVVKSICPRVQRRSRAVTGRPDELEFSQVGLVWVADLIDTQHGGEIIKNYLTQLWLARRATTG